MWKTVYCIGFCINLFRRSYPSYDLVPWKMSHTQSNYNGNAGPGVPPMFIVGVRFGRKLYHVTSACLIFMCVVILLLLHTTLFWAATQTVAEVISQFLQRGKLHLYVVIYKKDSPHCLSRLIINTSNKLKVSASSIFSIRKNCVAVELGGFLLRLIYLVGKKTWRRQQ